MFTGRVRIYVVGECMLDKYCAGAVSRGYIVKTVPIDDQDHASHHEVSAAKPSEIGRSDAGIMYIERSTGKTRQVIAS